jgi:hypothetical protein
MDYTDGTIVNWSELARRYQVKNKNGDCTWSLILYKIFF